MEMKTIELKNSEWLRGKKAVISRLFISGKSSLTGTQNKCCLGVLSRDVGFSIDELDLAASPLCLFKNFRETHKGMPRSKRFKAIEFLVVESKSSKFNLDNSKDAYAMMAINDSRTSSDKTKVKALNEIINKYGYEFVFKGKE
jgi:hypothetical protein